MEKLEGVAVLFEEILELFFASVPVKMLLYRLAMVKEVLKETTVKDPLYAVNRLISRAHDTLKKMLPLLSLLDINMPLIGAFK